MTTLLFWAFVAGIVAIILSGSRAAASAVKVGIGARIYRNTGTYGSPTWTSISLVRDATPGLPWDMSEAGSRETRAKLFVKTRADMSFSLSARADDADAGYLALRAAAVSPTAVLDLLVLDGLISVEGVHGFRAEFLINLASQPQEIDGSIYDQFEAKPAWSGNGYPSTVVMGAASSPTITAL